MSFACLELKCVGAPGGRGDGSYIKHILQFPQGWGYYEETYVDV